MRLTKSFYERNAVLVARELPGKRLVRCLNGERLSGTIVECEAYRQDDTACHAHRGMTQRNAVMFGPPGQTYVYFVYGMHFLLNIVAEQKGHAAAVLIRAIEPREGIETMQKLRGGGKVGKLLTGGPARLTQALAIDKSLNGTNLMDSDVLWVEENEATIADTDIACGPRIGIGYAAEPDLLAPWRFWVRGNPCVSR